MNVEAAELAPGYTISRLIRGGWQLGPDQSADALDDLAAFARAGITTFEVSDTYEGEEALLGLFLAEAPARLGEETARRIKVHTRYTAPLGSNAPSRARVTASIDRSRRLLGVERLDLLQIQWWDFAAPGLPDVAGCLADLAAAGKIGRLGVANFGIAPLKKLVDSGVPIVSNQVQYSLLDRRPENGLIEYCRGARIALLTYGALVGGFLANRWHRQPDDVGPAGPEEYRCIVDEAGGWDALQSLLAALDEVAQARGVDIATLALAWVLGRPGVTATLVGASSAARIPGLQRAGEMTLSQEDEALIGEALERFHSLTGDVGEYERDLAGPLARLIRSRLGAG